MGSFWRARGGVFLPGGFSQSRLVLVEEVFQSIAEIAQKMPSICYLLGVWSPVSGALSVSLRTVVDPLLVNYSTTCIDYFA